MGRKGLAPVIASMLMILLVLVLAAIIFLWAKGFVGEHIEKFGSPIEESCASARFDVARFDNELEVRNTGNVDIRHLEIKKFKGGDSEARRFDFQVDAGDAVMGYIDFDMSDGEVPDKIVVYPALIGRVQGTDSNNVFTCMESGVTL